MDTLTGIRVFRQIVESGTFAAAAERLDLSTAMVSKHVMHLEDRLGVRLLNRNSRTLSLTEAGRVYFERCKTLLDDLEATELELGSLNTTTRGTLRLTCPTFMSGQRMADLLALYHRQYPEVVIDLSFEDRIVDLVEEGYDLAIRAAADAASLAAGLIARPVRVVTFVLAASRDYVRQHGVPRTLEELSRHDLIGVANLESLSLLGPEGTVEVPLRPVMRQRVGAATHAIAAGIGIGPLPALVFEDPVFRDRLVPILPQYPLRKVTLYAVYVSRRYVPPKIRTFMEFLIAQASAIRDPRLLPLDSVAG